MDSLSRLHLVEPNGWAPGFSFRVGWTSARTSTANPMQMMKDFLSSFWTRWQPTSYAYLVGKAVDGQEKIVFLPSQQDGDEIVDNGRPVSTTTAHAPLPPTTVVPIAHQLATATAIVVRNRKPTIKKMANKLIKKLRDKHHNKNKTKSAPIWAAAAVVTAAELSDIKVLHDPIAIRAIKDIKDKNSWDCWTPGGASRPANAWLFMSLSCLFLLVCFWICGSTIFLSRQLVAVATPDGYVRLGQQDDDDSKNLLSSDTDDSEEESPPGRGPPSYEEAQLAFVSMSSMSKPIADNSIVMA